MSGSVIALSIKLEMATRQEGEAWLAWCPSLDVMTQADTEQRAISSLRQAVELWFESCIARDVLNKALLEAGFERTKPGEIPTRSSNIIEVHESQQPVAHPFLAKRDYIEVSIPAYIAAQFNTESPCAPR